VQKIVHHLWFDRDGADAAEMYISLFSNSFLINRSTIADTPSGTVETLSISLAGLDFTLLSAGPEFRFTPAVSFLVALETKEEVDRIWRTLREGGSELMPLGTYPFSERYAWVIDRFGLSWQLMFNGGGTIGQRITPTIMFVGEQCGKAEEAVSYYASVFGETRIVHLLHYGPGEEPNGEELIKHAAFSLEGQEFAAMDSAHEYDFTFNEAISFMVYCLKSRIFCS
jgi:predicted 3-demethylubiquinone-9 3-methyltransferase (glyoxalase superfamily)